MSASGVIGRSVLLASHVYRILKHLLGFAFFTMHHYVYEVAEMVETRIAPLALLGNSKFTPFVHAKTAVLHCKQVVGLVPVSERQYMFTQVLTQQRKHVNLW